MNLHRLAKLSTYLAFASQTLYLSLAPAPIADSDQIQTSSRAPTPTPALAPDPTPAGMEMESWRLVPTRNETLLGYAANALTADISHGMAYGTATLEWIYAQSDSDRLVSLCMRGAVEKDLDPVLRRMEERLGHQKAIDCQEGAKRFYCSTLQDVLTPWPFPREQLGHPSCDLPVEATVAPMQLESERDIIMCFVVFMVDEVEAVQSFLSLRGPSDIAVVHVDTKQPEAVASMKAWAASQRGVIIISRWNIIRAGPSMSLAVLEALDVAASSKSDWEVAFLVSGAHAWIRPRSELARYLFYHRTNFAPSEELQQIVDHRKAVSPHYEPHFECGGHYWQLVRDGNGRDYSTVLLPLHGHSNLTASQGTTFFAVRRDFVNWLSQTRKQTGSLAWVALRYTLRMFASIEAIMGTLLLSVSPWCHRTSAIYDLTWSRMHASQQKKTHSPESEKMESQALSSGEWGVKDLTLLRVGRWHFLQSLVSHGIEQNGAAPPKPEIVGYRISSEAERRAMDCAGCYDRLPILRSTEAVHGFGAFARKVDSPLRRILHSQDAQEPIPTYNPVRWGLAKRLWELWAPDCVGNRTFQTFARLCDLRERSLPCAAEFRVAPVEAWPQHMSCPVAIVAREKVAVGSGRVLALQIGSLVDPERDLLTEPGVIPNSTDALNIVFIAAAQRRIDLRTAHVVRIAVTPPPESGHPRVTTEAVVDLSSSVGRRTRVTFQGSAELPPPVPLGEWQVVLGPPEDPYSHPSGQRSFFVYNQSNAVDKEIFSRYFTVSIVSSTTSESRA